MIEVRFVDIHGKLKAMNLPLQETVKTIEEAKNDIIFIEGINIDGSSVKGFTPIEDSDLFLQPLKETIFELPYTEFPKLACMSKIYRNESVFKGDTRSLLEQRIRKLLKKNQTLMVGPEPEFFIMKDGRPADVGNYADVYPSASESGLIKRFSQDLITAGITTRVSHHEVAAGQYEIELGYNDALTIADTVINYKGLIRALAAKIGLEATFMPKPFEEMNGNGMHCHLSLWEGDNNLFSTGTPNEISEIGQYFIAGILHHAKALTAIVAPTVNSYKRLVPGFETPVYIAWAPKNRSALIRIPMFNKPDFARIEYRCPDPSCNIYLTLLGIIAAGMDGINKELELPKPVNRNIYHMTSKELEQLNVEILPRNLQTALEYLKQDRILRDALGDFVYHQFIKQKEQEWFEYSIRVTDWDWERYFDV